MLIGGGHCQWKVALVPYLPQLRPGDFDKICRNLFSFFAQNQRSRPTVSYLPNLPYLTLGSYLVFPALGSPRPACSAVSVLSCPVNQPYLPTLPTQRSLPGLALSSFHRFGTDLLPSVPSGPLPVVSASSFMTSPRHRITSSHSINSMALCQLPPRLRYPCL